jgi:hypothetical protein
LWGAEAGLEVSTVPYDAASASKTIEVVAPPPPWWEQSFLGLPVWAWLLIAGGAATVGGLAYYLEERGRELVLLLGKG